MSLDPPPGDATGCARGPSRAALRQPSPGPLARAELRLRDRRPGSDGRHLRRPAGRLLLRPRRASHRGPACRQAGRARGRRGRLGLRLRDGRHRVDRARAGRPGRPRRALRGTLRQDDHARRPGNGPVWRHPRHLRPGPSRAACKPDHPAHPAGPGRDPVESLAPRRRSRIDRTGQPRGRRSCHG